MFKKTYKWINFLYKKCSRLVYFLLLIIARNAALIIRGKILRGKSVKEEGTPLSSNITDIASDGNIEKCYSVGG